MNVPARGIRVATNVPQGDVDQWAFSFVTFYAHDRQVVPPRDWNRCRHNEWFMIVYESNKVTGQMRAIHIAPEHTVDGRIKGLDVMLRPASDPDIQKHTVQHFKMEEWALKWNKVKTYGNFLHSDLFKAIKDSKWKEIYLHAIPPFDSNLFCINFAQFFENMGLVDTSDVRYLTSLTMTPWPRADGSNLPYQI
ncbi:hypothetical protein ACGC1H_007547 [Rhizoctonia solani]